MNMHRLIIVQEIRNEEMMARAKETKRDTKYVESVCTFGSQF